MLEGGYFLSHLFCFVRTVYHCPHYVWKPPINWWLVWLVHPLGALGFQWPRQRTVFSSGSPVTLAIKEQCILFLWSAWTHDYGCEGHSGKSHYFKYMWQGCKAIKGHQCSSLTLCLFTACLSCVSSETGWRLDCPKMECLTGVLNELQVVASLSVSFQRFTACNYCKVRLKRDWLICWLSEKRTVVFKWVLSYNKRWSLSFINKLFPLKALPHQDNAAQLNRLDLTLKR